MKLRALIIVAIVVLAAFSVLSQPSPGLLWRAGFGGSSSEEFWDVAAGSSKILAVGRTSSFGSGGYDAFIALTSIYGDLEMLSALGWGSNDALYGVAGNPDYRSYAVGEIVDSTSSGWVLCLNSAGGIVWSEKAVGGDSLYLMDVAVYGSELVAVGAIEQDGDWNGLILIMDINGTLESSISVGGDDWEELRSVVIQGGEIFAFGTTSSGSSGPSDGLVVEMGLDGSLYGVWRVGTSGADWLLAAAPYAGSIYAVGGTTPSGSSSYKPLLLRIQGSGAGGYYLNTPFSAELYGVSIDAEGRIWASGQAVVNGDLQGIMLQGGWGSLNWALLYGNSGEDGLRGVVRSPGGAIYVAGFSTGASEDLEEEQLSLEPIEVQMESASMSSSDAGVSLQDVLVYRTDPTPTDQEAGIMKLADDSESPWVQIDNPQEGSVQGSSFVNVSWEGGDNEGIERYLVYLDGTLVYNGTSTTVALEIDSSGQHEVAVRAYDAAGNWGEDTVDFLVDLEGPWVNITSPSEGESVESPVEVTWEGGDDCYVDHYEVSVDGGPWTSVGNETSIELSLDAGQHTVAVRAYDPAGRYAEDSVTFTVVVGVPEMPL